MKEKRLITTVILKTSVNFSSDITNDTMIII